MPVLTVSEDDIVTLLSQLAPDARERVLNHFAVASNPSAPEAVMPRRADSVLDFLASMPRVEHTPEEWERIERELQQEKDAWDR